MKINVLYATLVVVPCNFDCTTPVLLSQEYAAFLRGYSGYRILTHPSDDDLFSMSLSGDIQMLELLT